MSRNLSRASVRHTSIEVFCSHMLRYDLLTEERNRVALPVREHPTEGFFAEGCNVPNVATATDACRVIDTALRGRIVGSHDLNARCDFLALFRSIVIFYQVESLPFHH